MRYAKEILIKIVESSNNYTEVVRKLGLNPTYGNRQTTKKYIDLFNINTDHFRNTKHISKSRKKFTIEEALTENSRHDRAYIKKLLFDNGLKEHKCEICGQGEIWLNKKITLILDHINGINNDNRLENLRIVCPNCNATFDTNGGKNIKIKYSADDHKKYCNCCGIEINKESTICPKCHQIKQRKVERPDYITLCDDIEKLGYSGTGRKYGVSDNSIRKWKKNYENNFIK